MIMDEMSDQGFPLTALREIKYLSTLDHENIVAIKQVIHAKRKYSITRFSFIANMKFHFQSLLLIT